MIKTDFWVALATKWIKNEGNFLMKFKNENFSREPSFKSIWQFLKVLKELVKLKKGYSLQTPKKIIIRKSGFSSKNEQKLK